MNRKEECLHKLAKLMVDFPEMSFGNKPIVYFDEVDVTEESMYALYNMYSVQGRHNETPDDESATKAA